MKHIHIIIPVSAESLVTGLPEWFSKAARRDTCISISSLTAGPASIESLFEDTLAAPQVVTRAVQAEKAGANAVVINCMNDPGLEAAREAVRIPVIGTAQASMITAGLLSHRFSVISTDRRDIYPIERLVERYGLKEKYASTRWVNIPVLDLHANHARLVSDLVEQSIFAVEQDGAHAIVFGCTVMAGLRAEVQAGLAAHEMNIPVIEPSRTALKWAENLAALDLVQSPRTYPSAANKLLPSSLVPGNETLVTLAGNQVESHKLSVIVPVVQGRREADWLSPTVDGYTHYAAPGNQLDVLAIEEGPAEITSPYDQAMAAPDVLRFARQVERDGAEAVLIDCMCDPGMEAAREALDIPVVGPLQASAFTAAMLARCFSIISTTRENLHEFQEKINGYGLGEMLASVRGVGASPIEVEQHPEITTQRMIEEARSAVLIDGAQAIIPGCTGMIGLADEVHKSLLREGIDVPVLEPPAVAARLAGMLCELGLSHSKLTWPKPPHKDLPGYSDLEF